MKTSSKYHFSFEDLKIYQKAIEIGELISRMVKKFPKEERFELSSQFKRAADSIALNIAEGASGTDRQFYHYLGNAWHSANECIACSTKARLRAYIEFSEDEEVRKYVTELSKMIATLRRTINNRINEQA